MKFEKKLIMLKGLDYDCKGTVTMEKNASALKCLINTYGLEDLDEGEYFLAVRSLDLPCQMRPLGSLGKINTRFELPPGMQIDNLHCVVASIGKKLEPVMYGTLSENKLWRGNMLDGLHRVKGGWLIGGAATDGNEMEKAEYPALAPATGETAAAPNYSKGKLTDYFLEITPEKAEEPYKSLYSTASEPTPQNLTGYADMYDDSAIAEVNYYNFDKVNNQPPECYIPPKPAASTTGYVPPDYGYGHQVYSSSSGIRPEPKDLRREGAAQTNRSSPSDLYRGYIQNTAQAPSGVPKKSLKESGTSSLHGGGAGVTASSRYEEPLVVPPPVSLKAKADKPSPKVSPSADMWRTKRNDTGLSRERDFSYDEKFSPEEEAAVTTQALNPAYAIPTIKTYSASSAKTAARTARVKPLTFFDKTRDQIEALFEKYPKEERLKNLIEDSRWVKVDWDNRGRHYVVGLIGVGPEYISYGVPAKYTPDPPKELDGYCQWMPIDPKEPEKDGYWLMFQDAKTGGSVMEY